VFQNDDDKFQCDISWNYYLQPFATDGCAQYLTSPTAPYLIAQAYREAGQPPPVLIACVRNPAEQALSWWKYENAGTLFAYPLSAWNQTYALCPFSHYMRVAYIAMQWSEGMLLNKWNVELRGTNYPPKSLKDAIQFSESAHVEELYGKAEQKVIADLKNRRTIRLPPWAMTWPGGQLSALGRNSRFAENIARYEKVFQSFDNTASKGDDSSLQCLNIFPLEYLGDDRLLKNFLVAILKRVAKRAFDMTAFEAAITEFQKSTKRLSTVHRNAGVSAGTTDELLAILPFFRQDQEKLNVMLKVNNIEIDYKNK
jgi:hypothetical protein